MGILGFQIRGLAVSFSLGFTVGGCPCNKILTTIGVYMRAPDFLETHILNYQISTQ